MLRPTQDAGSAVKCARGVRDVRRCADRDVVPAAPRVASGDGWCSRSPAAPVIVPFRSDRSWRARGRRRRQEPRVPGGVLRTEAPPTLTSTRSASEAHARDAVATRLAVAESVDQSGQQHLAAIGVPGTRTAGGAAGEGAALGVVRATAAKRGRAQVEQACPTVGSTRRSVSAPPQRPEIASASAADIRPCPAGVQADTGSRAETAAGCRWRPLRRSTPSAAEGLPVVTTSTAVVPALTPTGRRAQSDHVELTTVAGGPRCRFGAAAGGAGAVGASWGETTFERPASPATSWSGGLRGAEWRVRSAVRRRAAAESGAAPAPVSVASTGVRPVTASTRLSERRSRGCANSAYRNVTATRRRRCAHGVRGVRRRPARYGRRDMDGRASCVGALDPQPQR